MKKLLGMLLMLALLCTAALAVPADGAQVLDMNAKNYIDLDSDGAEESIQLKLDGVEGEEYIALYLFGADGSFYSYDIFALYLLDVWAADLNGDGLTELMVECDYYSDDYAVFCFNYTEDEGMTAVQFTGMDRTEIAEAYSDSGYGKITGVNGSCITLTGSQDVLGTWMASRDFILENGRFELQDGLFIMETDPEDWVYRPLIPQTGLEVTMEDGSRAQIGAGVKLLPVACDLQSIVHLVTQDGTRCSVNIARNEETGWGFLIGGVPDEEILEYIPYAD